MNPLSNIMMINPQASPKMPYDGPPLSVLAPLSGIAGTNRKVVVLDWHDTDFENKIASISKTSDICGITCMTGYQIKTMLRAAKIAKTANPGVIVVCGGKHPTLMPQQTLQSDLIDIVVIGQGMTTFPELVDAIENKKDLSAVKGIGFKQGDKIVLTQNREYTDMNLFPPVPYHLMENFNDYIPTTSFGKKTFYYLSSEGCPGSCKFCAEESLFHRRWHPLAVERIVDDIKKARAKYEFEAVSISDSNFYVSEKRVIEFCKAFKHLNMKWGGTSGRPDQLSKYSDETFALMKESGLQDIFLGVESWDNGILKIMDKGCSVEQTLNLLPRLHKHGIRVQCSFIIGVPGVDIKQDFKSTMLFINKLRKTGYVAQFHLFVYTPLPGTRFLEEAEKLGYKIPATLEEWTHYEFHAYTSPWIPKKYAVYTDAASVYFMFLAGHARTVIKAIFPKPILPIALLGERLMYYISLLRISTGCFAFPVEFRLIKKIIMNKDRLFRKKKIIF